MPASTATAAERVRHLPDNPGALDAYRALDVTARIVLDDGAECLLLTREGGVRATAPSEETETIIGDHAVARPPDAADDVPDVTVRLASEDLLALADGTLTVLRAVTASRLAARGPIFAAIGVAHVLTQL